ncbi:MAG: bifunctional phosphoribosyl-AMP cyclohydrolase/phosphoribosyl-ATP diphosphatase HisIE [Actinobacteria bacterium]|nr:bifunctional phosphoribosyl-AMP cyclohydrolase/phosphoribosyl-ATP diphosphatase HisIE [Actinomycetota bacterium]
MKRENLENDKNLKSSRNKNSPKIKLIPAVIQDFKTNEVLMLAYMNKNSLKKTMETKTTWFYSRSRSKLWNKGETSGNKQIVKEIRYDCDCDTLLIKVEQIGNACHTGNKTCFFSKLNTESKGACTDEKDYLKKIKFTDFSVFGDDILQELYRVIKERIKQKSDNSYTYALYKKGLEEILKKVGEESIEVVVSSKHQPKSRIIYEIADLIYHLMVLMVVKNITLNDIFNELKSRRK